VDRTPTQGPARRRRVHGAGFTLIEMMAVVAIIAMVFAAGLPRLSSMRWRALDEASDSIAASLEFARQRAVMTGVPHRVLIDLEDGDWRVEWLVDEAKANGVESADAEGALMDAQAPSPTPGEPDPNAPIDLHPPLVSDLDYYPVPNRLGRFTRLDDDLYFVGLDGGEGWVEGGHVQIVFDADGSTDPVLLELADAKDRHLTLEIEPLLERVRRHDGPARS